MLLSQRKMGHTKGRGRKIEIPTGSVNLNWKTQWQRYSREGKRGKIKGRCTKTARGSYEGGSFALRGVEKNVLWTLWRTTRLMNILKTGQEWMSLGEVWLQLQSVCQGTQELVWLAKDTLQQAHAIKVWPCHKRDDRTAELLEVVHLTQETQSFSL